MGAMQSALEQQIETLNESVHGEFGEGMARVSFSDASLAL